MNMKRRLVMQSLPCLLLGHWCRDAFSYATIECFDIECCAGDQYTGTHCYNGIYSTLN